MTDEANQGFVEILRQALQGLYDPVELQRSPLVALFGLERRPNPALALQETLIAAIQALKPAARVPSQANAWRFYHILTYRYVEQAPQKQVADDLALSIRQLRRLESEAIALLADSLARRYDLSQQTQQLARAPERESEPPVALPDRARELDWLRKSLPSETADLSELVTGVLQTAQPVLRATGVTVRFDPPPEPAVVLCQVTTLRQALLNLLTVACRAAAGGQVAVGVVTGAQRAEVHIRSVAASAPLPKNNAWQESIALARQLLELSDGTLAVETGRESPFAARLSLHLAEQTAVLAIDDNPDTLQLLERYLAGSRYRLISVHDPEQALNLAAKVAPCAIVLDVMLPSIDGWELLGRLRTHPATADVPVIVATILPQEQLALALGAAAFLCKPFNRETLLTTLAKLTQT